MSNVIPFPPKAATCNTFPVWPPLPKTRTVTLLHLDGSFFAQAGFLPGSMGDSWAWICETVARQFECAEDDVHSVEGDVNSPDWCGDWITADGVPVCTVAF